MINPKLIGDISLNMAFFLYLIVYVPQIIHNRRSSHLRHFSISMHHMLLMGYSLDLIYGFSAHLQWQYKTVSVVGFVLLLIQQAQLTRYLLAQKQTVVMRRSVVFLCFTAVFFLYFTLNQGDRITTQHLQMIGYASRACFLFYLLPQILKNKRMSSAKATSVSFVYLNITLSLLDFISAWCLDWGWPNKLAAPITLSLMIILLMQIKKNRSHQRHLVHSMP